MTENEKLRALLTEARCRLLCACGPYECLCGAGELAYRIDAALAEPVVGCAECEQERREYDSLAAHSRILQRERDEARAEVKALREVLNAFDKIAIKNCSVCPRK
jgi:hypothetical protein